MGNSLTVQWLGLQAFTNVGLGLIPGWGTKILQATQCGQGKNKLENRLVVAKGEGVGGGMEWEVGISRCKLLYIEWINNKV